MTERVADGAGPAEELAIVLRCGGRRRQSLRTAGLATGGSSAILPALYLRPYWNVY